MRRLTMFILVICLIVTVMTGCGRKTSEGAVETTTVQTEVGETTTKDVVSRNMPKYIFLFIGDGMSYPQIQAASAYLGALEDEDYMLAAPSREDNQEAVLDGPVRLNFMDFAVHGAAVNHNSSSFITDSASAATALLSGHKTYDASINVDETGRISYESIAEKLHEQKGMKIGVISSVNLNHATPAGTYAHQKDRESYYEIGLELVNSGYEYFAGGGFRKPEGNNSDHPMTSLYELAEQAGYRIADTREKAEKITPENEKVIIVEEDLADSNSMPYSIDREELSWTLADYVKKGIEQLDQEKGFFLLCEGGKIDWACHANDAASAIHDVLALEEAVQAAIDFAEEHPEETLILVTGDHETGGLTLGYAETEYDSYPSLLAGQKISFKKFNTDYVSVYKKNRTSFEQVLQDVESLFGLKREGAEDEKLQLTEYELECLEMAYRKSILKEKSNLSVQEEMAAYGEYEPLTITILRILNHKAGFSFTSYEHTALPVAVFAEGIQAELFEGYYDNTEIYKNLAQILEVR